MSKSKRGKSGSAHEISRWEAGLVEAPFSEDEWRGCVFFVAPNKVDDDVFINIMGDVVSTGLRKLFSIITKESLYKDVKEFAKPAGGGGKGKGAATPKLPLFHEICEHVKPMIDQGEKLPAGLMAKLLKFKLLHIKQKDFDRIEEEKKALKAAEDAKKKEEKGGSGSGRKTASPSGKRSKSPGKGKKGKKEPDLPPAPKKDSKLKKRGEDEDTFKTIDDEPDDPGCPQHYVLIHGILNAPVIHYLGEIGVKVDAVIRVTAETYDRFAPPPPPEAKPEDEDEELDNKEIEEKVKPEIDPEAEAAKAVRQAAEAELSKFWKASDKMVMMSPSGHSLRDVARYQVVVKDKNVPVDLFELEGEKKTEFGASIFNNLADVCYDMLDHWQQYKDYLESMKLLNIPGPGDIPATSAPSIYDQPVSQPTPTATITGTEPMNDIVLPSKPDTRYYNHLLKGVPTESCGVPLILHCMLEQVVATVEDNNPLDKDLPPRTDGLNHLLADYINSKTGKLALKSDEKQAILEPVPVRRKTKEASDMPLILCNGDNATMKAHHLVEVNGLMPLDAELRMLEMLPYNQLFGYYPQFPAETLLEQASRAHEMKHYCTSKTISTSLLDHALKQYSFEGMLLKQVDDMGEIVHPEDFDEAYEHYINPWDDPYTNLSQYHKVKLEEDRSGKFKMSISMDKVSAVGSFRNLDEWCYMEHFDKKTLLQVLDSARPAFPYMDTYYNKRDQSLLVALHNPVGPDLKSSASWDAELHSNVGFRNYLEHVADLIDNWLKEEERKKAELNRQITPPPPPTETPTIPIKIGSRYGMQTREELALLKAEEEEKGKKKGRKSKSPRGRSASKSPNKKDKDSSPDKKDKKDKRDGSAGSRGKSAASRRGGRSKSRQDLEPELVDEAPPQPTEEKVYDFIGYNVGDSLIHVSGDLSTMFPSEGGQIRVEKTAYVHGPKSVHASVYKDGNVFTLHFLEPVDEIVEDEEEEGEGEGEGTKTEERKHKESMSESVSQAGEEENNPSEHAGGEAVEKSELEGNEKGKTELKGPTPFCDFSSFIAQLNDGLMISMSGYGPSGTLKTDDDKKTVDLQSFLHDLEPSRHHPQASSPPPKAGSPKSRKKADEEQRRQEELHQQQEQEKLRAEEEAKKLADMEKLVKPFQHVFITCPDGLRVQYLNDNQYTSSDDKGGIIVRQEYPIKTLGVQECEATRLHPAMDEACRLIMTDGTVIKMMLDGSVQVLFADGALSRCPSIPCKHIEFVKPSSATSSRPTQESIAGGKKGQRAPQPPRTPDELLVAPPPPVKEKVAEWVSTNPEGERIGTNLDGEIMELSPVLLAQATCPHTQQVLKTREDNVLSLDYPDGTFVVEHADGTRITTFYADVKQLVEDSSEETGESATYESVSVRHVKVECEGFATVIMNVLNGSCETLFGKGTCAEMQPDGASVFTQNDGSKLHFNAKGDAVFIPKTVQCPILDEVHRPCDGSPVAATGVYVMRTTKQQCCEMVDKEGNFFTVSSNGEMDMRQVALSEWDTSVDDANDTSNEEDVFKHDENKDSSADEDPNRSSTPIVIPEKSLHSPRFFIVHSDGSGSELLHPADLSEFFKQATADESTAVLRNQVEGHPDLTGITVLKPYTGGISKIWLKNKDKKMIIPVGLRERDFKTFPARENKTPGPNFGTKAGSGVNVGNVIKAPPPTPPITCPRALELRQFIQYQPLTLEQRAQIVRAMAAYADFTTKRDESSDNLLPKEPRSEEEVKLAQDLADKLNTDTNESEQASEKDIQDEEENKKVDISSQEIPPLKDEVKEAAQGLADQVQSGDVPTQYVDAITAPVVPDPPPPTWKRPMQEWEKDRIELAELEYAKNSIKYGLVPPYFDTAQGQAFLYSSKDTVDMEALTQELAVHTRHPPQGESPAASTPEAETSCTGYTSDTNLPTSDDQGPTPQTSMEQLSLHQSLSQEETPSPAVADDSSFSPTKMRPTNPTPAHAAGTGTPTLIRPNNPTPAHAAISKPVRPNNPTPLGGDSDTSEQDVQRQGTLESVQELEHDTTIEEENLDSFDYGTVDQGHAQSTGMDGFNSTVGSEGFGVRSLYTDVAGEPRKDRVKLPNSILSSKPGALPNTQFQSVEDPVRRRVHTVSVTGGDPMSQVRVKSMRGFELLPPEVDFGVLREGCTYRFPVLLKNVGIDSCRYKIKQPPPSTGLRVIFTPGPVAAGMSVQLEVEIFAVAVGVEGDRGVGAVGHHVEIVTENEAIYLPVSATIVTAYEYQNPSDGLPVGLPNAGVFELSTRPPSRDAIRPRRD